MDHESDLKATYQGGEQDCKNEETEDLRILVYAIIRLVAEGCTIMHVTAYVGTKSLHALIDS